MQSISLLQTVLHDRIAEGGKGTSVCVTLGEKSPLIVPRKVPQKGPLVMGLFGGFSWPLVPKKVLSPRKNPILGGTNGNLVPK